MPGDAAIFQGALGSAAKTPNGAPACPTLPSCLPAHAGHAACFYPTCLLPLPGGKPSARDRLARVNRHFGLTSLTDPIRAPTLPNSYLRTPRFTGLAGRPNQVGDGWPPLERGGRGVQPARSPGTGQVGDGAGQSHTQRTGAANLHGSHSRRAVAPGTTVARNHERYRPAGGYLHPRSGGERSNASISQVASDTLPLTRAWISA